MHNTRLRWNEHENGTDKNSMDWFLYDIGLRHERVKWVNTERNPLRWVGSI